MLDPQICTMIYFKLQPFKITRGFYKIQIQNNKILQAIRIKNSHSSKTYLPNRKTNVMFSNHFPKNELK